MKYGTDRYGETHAPILVSILDIDSLVCPRDPASYDEYYRVTRRARRNPAGANLLTDQPMLKTMELLTRITGEDNYHDFVQAYQKYYMAHLTDDKGMFWWGWHRHYDVYRDVKDGHGGNHHEIHAIHGIDWESLWNADPKAVENEINAIWEWHVIDKGTCEINRHADGRAGCDFSMSAGAYIEAFAFIYQKKEDPIWVERAMCIADYYWDRRDPETNLFPERPNAGRDRFDGSTFVTSITGTFCHSLLKAYEFTGEAKFQDHALAYLKAYAQYGYDDASGQFWGALQLDGMPIPGPRVYTDNIDSQEGYAANQPRGRLDLWEPYVAGYQFAIYTAQAYAYAYEVSGDDAVLQAAKRFARWIDRVPPGTMETPNTWYKGYSQGPGRQGTYADKYGRTISFFLHLYVLTGELEYLESGQYMADMAIQTLYDRGWFRGHPAKSYYEAMDGVGYLLYAFLQLDIVLNSPDKVVLERQLISGNTGAVLPMDNW
jgi:hypothetical protein